MTPRAPHPPPRARRGQALAELAVMLVVLIILVLGVCTLGDLALRQLRLRHDVRLEAGEAALTRATAGWVDPAPAPETRSDPFHRVNAYARLDAYAPQPISRLPASNYTLAARDLPEGELGLQTETREERVPLEAAFIDLIYDKNSVLLRETAAFPAASGLWE